MTTMDAQGRIEPPYRGDESSTLLGFLDWMRQTVAWKTADLDAAGLRATLAPSTMTLGGMLMHLAYVEDSWFGTILHGDPPSAPWDAVDWATDPDWDWHSAADHDPEALRTLWRDAVETSRARCGRALEGGGMDHLAVGGLSDGSRISLRWIIVHMIEEYGRHLGHIDLLRESIDGLTGE